MTPDEEFWGMLDTATYVKQVDGKIYCKFPPDELHKNGLTMELHEGHPTHDSANRWLLRREAIAVSGTEKPLAAGWL
jgi:hypothetical protein